MTLKNAINIRCSRRKYSINSIDYHIANKLKSLIDEYNQESGLNIQFVLNNGKAFEGLRRNYGMLSGVQNYFGLIEDKHDENSQEKLGYYGELLVLHATALGLGTCWVGGTFDRNFCPFTLSNNESIACVITVGNVESYLSMKESIIRRLTHRKTKSIEQMYVSDASAPEWFISGMRAVQKAPSAVNRQPVMFHYTNGIVTASVKNISDPMMALDLGIAKLHFEIGAGGGNWSLGNGAGFAK